MKTANAVYNLERFTDVLEEHKAHKENMDIWPNHVLHFNKTLFDELISRSFKFSNFREQTSRVLSSFRHCVHPYCPSFARQALRAHRSFKLNHDPGARHLRLRTSEPPKPPNIFEAVALL
eukprot:3672350-Amphidinium_carterae.1